MSQRLEWERAGADWPHRASSRFVSAGGLDWHVQEMGSGSPVLLVHGTGASTHSWQGLAPLLAQSHRVIALDLPGHGFTSSPPASQLSLPGMASLVQALLDKLELAPVLAVGHSAGAAILIRMSLDSQLPPQHKLVSVNGALFPFGGIAGQILSPIAKLLTRNPFVPKILAWRAANRPTVERVLADTGSRIGREYIDLYARLFQSPAHVSSALGMMANWSLEPLVADLPRLTAPLLLIAAGEDRAVSADEAFRARELNADFQVSYLRGLGHLAHEENPDLIAQTIRTFAAGQPVTTEGHQP